MANLLFIGVVIFAFPAAALAHARVVQTDPADNATLKESPSRIHLEFSEPVSSQFSSFRVLDVRGQLIAIQDVVLDDSRKQVALGLPKLGNGIYSVVLKVVSDRDGHITHGHIVFAVGDVALAAAVSVREESNPTWIEVALRWLNIIAISSFAGGFLVSFMCLRGQFVQSLALSWTATWSRVALAVSLGLLAQHIWTLAESSSITLSTLSLIVNVLTQTGWGLAWLLRGAALIVFIVSLRLLLQLPRPPRAWLSAVTAVLSIAAVCVAQALASHAAQSILMVGLQAVHTLAASAWMGGLTVMILMSAKILRRVNNDHEPSLKQLWVSFSQLAFISMIALVGTGLFNVAQQVSTVDAVLMTPYGKALLTKVVIVAIVTAIAATNGWVLRRHATDLIGLLARARVEVLLGLVILVVTALLASISPANGPEFDAPTQVLNSMNATVDDLLVTLTTKPNRPGPNVFTIVAASSRRPERAAVLRVQLRFSSSNTDLGVASAIADRVDVDTYRVGGNYLSMPGQWQVDVVVRRKGLEDSVAHFNWAVPDPAARPQSVIISNRPIRTPLMLVGLVAMLILPLLVVGASRWARKQLS